MEPPIESGGSIDPEPSQLWMFGGPLGSAELSWEWATERLSLARNHWIATTRPAGQPHSRPVWGVWLDNTFHFSTGSLAAQDLATQPAITVHLESGNEVAILEGIVVNTLSCQAANHPYAPTSPESGRNFFSSTAFAQHQRDLHLVS